VLVYWFFLFVLFSPPPPAYDRPADAQRKTPIVIS
jgi:hypothetical protein